MIYLGYLLAGVILIVRIIDIQLRYEPDPTIASLFKPRSIRQTLYPERGSILARDGRLMAMSLPMYRVFMDCTVRKAEFEDMKKSTNPKRKAKGTEREKEWKEKATSNTCYEVYLYRNTFSIAGSTDDDCRGQEMPVLGFTFLL